MANPITPRSAPKPEPNPLVDSPGVALWTDVESYFTETRERTISELAHAEDLKGLYQAQGKLALLDELANLRAILFTLDHLGKE